MLRTLFYKTANSFDEEPPSLKPFHTGCLSESLNAPIEKCNNSFFVVTHCFHPLYKRKFPLADYQNRWGEERVFFYDDKGEFSSLPACWTSLYPQDPFVVLSQGRALFHIEGLLELAQLMEHIKKEILK